MSARAPHIPTQITLCGRIRDLVPTTLNIAQTFGTVADAVDSQTCDISAPLLRPMLVYDAGLQGTKEATYEVSCIRMAEHCPDILNDALALQVSSCSNAIFFALGPDLPPRGGDFIYHLVAQLVDHSVLGQSGNSSGHVEEKLTGRLQVCFPLRGEGYAAMHPAMRPYAAVERGTGLSESARLPCYLITQWTMDLPPLASVWSDFAYTPRSVLDEFAVAKPGKGLLPSWQYGFAVLPQVGSSGTQADTAMPFAPRPEVIMGTVPCLETDAVEQQQQQQQQQARDSGGLRELSEVDFLFLDLFAEVQRDAKLAVSSGKSDGNPLAHVEWSLLASRLMFWAPRTQEYYTKLGVDLINAERFAQAVTQRADGLIAQVTAWVFGALAQRHPAATDRAKSARLLRGFRKLAGRFYADGPALEPAAARAAVVWRDFMVEHSIARLVFPWLNGWTLDPQVAQVWDIVFDVMVSVAKHFCPEHLHLEGFAPDENPGAAFVAPAIRSARGFLFQRTAVEYYFTRLIDRTRMDTRSADLVDENRKASRAYLRSGDVPDDEQQQQQQQQPQQMSPEDAKRAKEGFYAMKGYHGNGHVFAPAKITESPFDFQDGKFLVWLLRKPETEEQLAAMRAAPFVDIDRSKPDEVDGIYERLVPFCNVHSPIVAEPSPAGPGIKVGIDYRITAYTDYASMFFIRNAMQAMANRFAASKETFRTWIEGNRRKVFSDPEARRVISMSNGATLAFSEQQSSLIDKLSDECLSIITGGGGTGKSTLTAGLAAIFSGSNVPEAEQIAKPDEAPQAQTPRNKKRAEKNSEAKLLAEAQYGIFAGYGKPAMNFVKLHGRRAYTIHYLAAMCNKDFLHDDRMVIAHCRSPSRIRVAIVDEISVISLPHLVMLFNACPNLEKLIIVGDVNQMESIERGNIGEVFMNLFGTDAALTTRLSFNYRLTNDTSDTVRMAQRTQEAFDAIIAGTDIMRAPHVFGPYKADGLASALPGICQVHTWDAPLIHNALKRAPVLLLPHAVNPKRALDPVASMEETLEQLLTLVGRRPEDWADVQLMTQRRKEEMEPISNYLTRKLFPHIECVGRDGTTPPYNNLYVGEKVVIKERVKAFSPNGSRCFIARNDIRIIQKIEDCLQITLHGEGGDTLVYKNPVPRASTRTYVPGKLPMNHKRVVTFSDGFYVVCDYTSGGDFKALDFMRRGICVTNASMQGSSAKIVIGYIRPGVSHTFSNREFYTLVSRMCDNCVLVSTPAEIAKTIMRPHPKRHNQFGEILASVNLRPAVPEPPPSVPNDAMDLSER